MTVFGELPMRERESLGKWSSQAKMSLLMSESGEQSSNHEMEMKRNGGKIDSNRENIDGTRENIEYERSMSEDIDGKFKSRIPRWVRLSEDDCSTNGQNMDDVRAGRSPRSPSGKERERTFICISPPQPFKKSRRSSSSGESSKKQSRSSSRSEERFKKSRSKSPKSVTISPTGEKKWRNNSTSNSGGSFKKSRSSSFGYTKTAKQEEKGGVRKDSLETTPVRLQEIDTTSDDVFVKHDETLQNHAETLQKHVEMLQKHGEMLPKQDETLQKQSERLQKPDVTSQKHDDTSENRGETFRKYCETFPNHEDTFRKCSEPSQTREEMFQNIRRKFENQKFDSDDTFRHLSELVQRVKNTNMNIKNLEQKIVNKNNLAQLRTEIRKAISKSSSIPRRTDSFGKQTNKQTNFKLMKDNTLDHDIQNQKDNVISNIEVSFNQKSEETTTTSRPHSVERERTFTIEEKQKGCSPPTRLESDGPDNRMNIFTYDHQYKPVPISSYSTSHLPRAISKLPRASSNLPPASPPTPITSKMIPKKKTTSKIAKPISMWSNGMSKGIMSPSGGTPITSPRVNTSKFGRSHDSKIPVTSPSTKTCEYPSQTDKLGCSPKHEETGGILDGGQSADPSKLSIFYSVEGDDNWERSRLEFSNRMASFLEQHKTTDVSANNDSSGAKKPLQHVADASTETTKSLEVQGTMEIKNDAMSIPSHKALEVTIEAQETLCVTNQSQETLTANIMKSNQPQDTFETATPSQETTTYQSQETLTNAVMKSIQSYDTTISTNQSHESITTIIQSDESDDNSAKSTPRQKLASLAKSIIQSNKSHTRLGTLAANIIKSSKANETTIATNQSQETLVTKKQSNGIHPGDVTKSHQSRVTFATPISDSSFDSFDSPTFTDLSNTSTPDLVSAADKSCLLKNAELYSRRFIRGHIVALSVTDEYCMLGIDGIQVYRKGKEGESPPEKIELQQPTSHELIKDIISVRREDMNRLLEEIKPRTPTQLNDDLIQTKNKNKELEKEVEEMRKYNEVVLEKLHKANDELQKEREKKKVVEDNFRLLSDAWNGFDITVKPLMKNISETLTP